MRCACPHLARLHTTGRRFRAAMAASTGPAGPPEPTATAPMLPCSGMTAESRLLEQLCAIPMISRISCTRPSWPQQGSPEDGIEVTVHANQRNLAANSKRKWARSCRVSAQGLASQPSGPITEARDVLMTSTSPSGAKPLWETCTWQCLHCLCTHR